MKYKILAVTVLFALTACGDVSSRQKDEIVKVCLAKFGLSETVCECIGKKAKDDLTQDERSMLIAMISEDKEKANEMRGSMTAAAMMKAGMFMAMAPAECSEKNAK